jgi:hypothetical protein
MLYETAGARRFQVARTGLPGAATFVNADGSLFSGDYTHECDE